MDFEQEDGVKEVHPGLILGGLHQFDRIMETGPEVLVPLDQVPGEVWDWDFRGEILYYPAPDGGILPDRVLERLVEQVLERLKENQRVALFCAGGHGRTGYAAACILFQLGQENPIAYLHQHYSPRAVETAVQQEAVERFCYRHIARTYWHCKYSVRTVQVQELERLCRDPEVLETCRRLGEELGPRARFLVKRDIRSSRLHLLAEAPDRGQCQDCIRRFEEVLRRRGYLAEG